MPSVLTDKLLPAISWTLVHSLWQGIILTIVTGILLFFTRRSSPVLRYNLLCSILVLFLGAVAVSFFIEWNAASDVKAGTSATLNERVFESSPFAHWVQGVSDLLNSNAEWIVGIWLMLFLFKSGRMLMDMLYVRRLRSHKCFAPEENWISRVQELGAGLGIRSKIALMESAMVKVPVVLGHFRPLVLVPVGLLSHLPPGEVEAVLLHELAHIRRHDYLVNFVQRIAEMLFFFNPGLLWISSLIRAERENCCDDLAIGQTQDKVVFAEALIRCKEHSMSAHGYALGFLGQKNLLLQRLTRIVYNSNKSLSSFEFGFLIINLVAGALLLTGMRNADQSVQPLAIAISQNNTASFAIPSTEFASVSASVNKEMKKAGAERSTVNRTSPRRTPQKPSKVFSEIDHKKDEMPVKNELGNISAANINHEMEQNRVPGERDHIEAIRIQIQKDRRQAELDREQAVKDREQANRDRVQAAKDRMQADKDRLQADKDRQQAEKDREQARKDREQADRDRKRHSQ